ncbi:hypothetical protein [Desulforhopalus sp. 52FAK]
MNFEAIEREKQRVLEIIEDLEVDSLLWSCGHELSCFDLKVTEVINYNTLELHVSCPICGCEI